ncbi:MAG: MnhB domain-containing protein [Planctomycetota bacterium]|jgi:multicomponent Na+:H+ antiporter subunit B
MKGMTVIVKNISSWVKVLIFIFGIYIILFGHLTPGGGFPGGVILASSFVLLMLAFSREQAEKYFPLSVASKMDCSGAFLFILLGLMGLLYSVNSFFYNFIQQEYLVENEGLFKLISAGSIPISNILIGLKVCASLFLVIVVLSMARPEIPPDE